MRNNRKVLLLTALAMVMALAITGCGKKSKTVATINGEPLSEASYRGYLFSVKMEMEQGLGPGIWEIEMEGESMEKIAKERALESAVAMSVTSAKAKEMQLKLTPEQKEEAKTIAANYVAQLKGPLAEEGVTEDVIREMMEDIIMSQNVLEELERNFTPSEDADEFEKFVEENKMSLETVTAQHVLISTLDDDGNPLSEDEEEKAKEKAEEILEKALAGDDMGELAKEYSDDPGSKDEGGEYTFGRDEMVPEFEEAAFNGEAGKVHPELVKTIHGYHIVKTIEKTEPTEEELKEAFKENQKAEYISSELDEWITGAKVEKTELYDAIEIKKPEPEPEVEDSDQDDEQDELDDEGSGEEKDDDQE
ncbi:MAG: hypothetical protein GX366_06505 [Epulopiscium sp.]|nr:hypothetical protein [Candidatus Epulonipiscium sp.]